MLTVNFWPALAVTPHTGSLLVSVLVWLPVKSWHAEADVGNAEGAAEGASEGIAEGGNVGMSVGFEVGVAELGNKVGAVEGLGVLAADGRRVGACVGSEVGSGVAAKVGAVVGDHVSRYTPAAPEMAALPEHVV